MNNGGCFCFFFSSRRRHTRWTGDWSSDVCSSDLPARRAAKAHGVARAEKRELPVANLLAFVSDERRALEYVRHRLLLARKRDGDIGPRFDRPVLIDDRDVRVDH